MILLLQVVYRKPGPCIRVETIEPAPINACPEMPKRAKEGSQ